MLLSQQQCHAVKFPIRLSQHSSVQSFIKNPNYPDISTKAVCLLGPSPVAKHRNHVVVIITRSGKRYPNSERNIGTKIAERAQCKMYMMAYHYATLHNTSSIYVFNRCWKLNFMFWCVINYNANAHEIMKILSKNYSECFFTTIQGAH